jgi:hypothetical protein
MIDHEAAAYLYDKMQLIESLLAEGEPESTLEVAQEAIQAIDNNDLPEEKL